MSALSRGTRNVSRNVGRSVLTVLIVGLSVGIFAAMAQTGAEMERHIRILKEQVEKVIELRVPGGTAMGSGTEILAPGIREKLVDIPNIEKVERYLFVREVDNTKKYPVSARIGLVPGETYRLNSHGEVGTPTVIMGRGLTPEDLGKNVALVGKVYAEESPSLAESVKKGALPPEGVPFAVRFTVDGKRVVEEFRAVGFFESGFVFGDNQLIMPLDTLQRIIGKEEAISNIFVTVTDVESVPQVEENLYKIIGDQADVLTGMSRSRFAEQALGKVASSSRIGIGLSAAVAALVILFTMALVTRERTKEIGVLKALGASDGNVAVQFAIEALVLSLIGGVLGFLIFATVGPTLAVRILGLERVNLTGLTGMGAQEATELLRFGLSGGMAAAALGMSLLLGAVGSLYPVARALRLRPSEAMRML